jgi:hypothetical protein
MIFLRTDLGVIVKLPIIFVSFLLSACCHEAACRLERKLKEMPDEEAFSYFRRIPAREQVDLYVWELNVSKPVSSRYEFLLRENSSEVAIPLLDSANSSDKYMVIVSILSTLERMPEGDKRNLPTPQVRSAIQKCKSLALADNDELCLRAEAALLEKNKGPNL